VLSADCPGEAVSDSTSLLTQAVDLLNEGEYFGPDFQLGEARVGYIKFKGCSHSPKWLLEKVAARGPSHIGNGVTEVGCHSSSSPPPTSSALKKVRYPFAATVTPPTQDIGDPKCVWVKVNSTRLTKTRIHQNHRIYMDKNNKIP